MWDEESEATYSQEGGAGQQVHAENGPGLQSGGRGEAGWEGGRVRCLDERPGCVYCVWGLGIGLGREKGSLQRGSDPARPLPLRRGSLAAVSRVWRQQQREALRHLRLQRLQRLLQAECAAEAHLPVGGGQDPPARNAPPPRPRPCGTPGGLRDALGKRGWAKHIQTHSPGP